MAVPYRSGENCGRVSGFVELVARDPRSSAGTGQCHTVTYRGLLQVGCQSWRSRLIFRRKGEKRRSGLEAIRSCFSNQENTQ